jgi:hypothetical protein
MHRRPGLGIFSERVHNFPAQDAFSC